ncbi:MAG: hypothetical protein O7B32_02185 [Thaumarchaeota archaeon]|nr:hypothetical protein [Nitrososphaerota archaeon]
MLSKKVKLALGAIAWASLGIGIVVFYLTYITVNTYYSPTGSLVIIALGIFIVGLAVINYLPQFRKAHPRQSSDHKLTNTVQKIQARFWKILSIAILVVLADIVITTYTVSRFGLSIEGNQVVVFLLSQGDFFSWFGQQLMPLMIAGALFSLIKGFTPRTGITFYVLGTLVYAGLIVINNIVVLISLTLF